MNSITNYLRSSLHYLNEPTVKSSIKYAIGLPTFTFGVLEILDATTMYLVPRLGHEPRKVRDLQPSTWRDTTNKVINVLSRVSLVTSTMTTPQGLKICGWAANKIFTPEQLIRYFGPNLNFETTPWHPRHVLSLISFAIGVPGTVGALCNKFVWFKPSRTLRWVTDNGAARYVTWNTLTSRPAQHGLNYLFRTVLR